MHDKLHFSGDANADKGYWSPSTSAANFCEEDYAVTRFVAEFINALSNVAYIYLALHYSNSRHGKLDLMSTSLVVVGTASFLFHATLRLPAQLCDDISMLFLASALLRTLYCANQLPARRTLITATIYAIVCGMSAFYIRSGNLLVHVGMFVGMLTLVWPRTLYLFANRQDQGRLARKFGTAVGYLGLAFLVWNIDLHMCEELRSLRAAVGLPWAWILELHGWWHILTAAGAAVYMDLIRDLCF